MDFKNWDDHYQAGEQAPKASAVLSENTHLLPESGRALDLACGLGANALALAKTGLQVAAWDMSTVALDKLTAVAEQEKLPINTLCRDVEKQPPEANSFDVIVVSHFLYRPICEALSLALKPGGLLFYQTFCLEKVLPGSGPSSSQFLLQPQELLVLFKKLEILHYKEERDCGDIGKGLRNEAYLLARRAVCKIC